MNFAIPFMRNFKYFQDAVQLNINYKPKIKQLENFIIAYGEKHRINLFIKEINSDDYEIIQALIEKYPSYKIILCLPYYNKELEQQLNDKQLPHYYNEFVTTWDKFQGFLSLNVTDIFIGENLAFNAKILSDLAKKNSKSLRCFCNVCQSAWEETVSFKTFFIRPDDIYLYENLIDTFEFYIDTSSPAKLNTIYEIYAKKQKWFGKLNEIIVGFEGEEDSRFIIPRFGLKRLNCGQECMKGIQSNCNICERIIELSKTLKDAKLVIKIDK